MSSSSPIARWSVVIAPLFFFGCFTASDGGGDDDDDGGNSQPGCRVDADCRAGRVCLELDGDGDGLCAEGEKCSCGPPDASGGSSNGGTGGGDTGGSTTGGSGDGGTATGGNATGGNATGGNATGGSATGGNATGGSATGGSSTGGSSGAADCGAYCTRVLGAMCASFTEAQCLADCNGVAMDCPAEAPAVVECVVDPANPITCLSGAPVIDGCDPELEARDRCIVCAPETGDMACVTCSKGNCCDEIGDYVLSPDGQAFYDCASVCTTQACFDGCVSMYPVAGAANLALGTCQDTSCPEECICEAATDDDACDTCYKANCCAEFVDYVLAPNALEFDECAAACADDLCIQECADAYPEAGAAFLTLIDCVDQSCATQCQ
jgi:hypothetical protein